MAHAWLIGHRGAAGEAPESTAAAIRRAVQAGVDMIELDVQLTRDGRLVIFHDERLERTTAGRGRVTEWAYRDLARLDAGGWYASRFRGERILLMSQALRLIPRRCRVNLELKATSKPQELIRRFVRCLRQTRAGARVLVSSFELPLLERLRRVAPEVAIAVLCHRRPWAALREACRLGCVALHPQATLVTPTLVRDAHAAGLRVHVWTVDRPSRARALLRLRVDGIVTNVPGRFRTFWSREGFSR